ncbi:hypothetical protein Tco_0687824, partial [Tanacetum coccineum]
RRDEDDSNNDRESRSKGSNLESVSVDDNTQSDSEKGSDSEHETDENESGSESDQEENEEEIEDDEEEEEDELVKTPSNSTDDEEETNVDDKTEGDEDEGMDYTTNQFDDDVNVRLNEPVDTDEGLVQKEGTDSKMTNKTEVLVTSSSHSSNLASKFLNFSDIPHTDAKIVSPIDVHVHHEVPSKQTPTLLTVPVSVITDSSPVYSTVIPQSLPSFTPPPQQSTPTPPPTIEAINPLSTLPNFTSVFQFNNRVTTLENEVAELKKNDPLNTQVTALVDEHLDSRLGATKDEFISYISESITARITEQSYALDKSLFSTYDKVYSLKRSRKDKDKDEDPSTGSDRGLKKRKTSKDAEPTTEEPEFEVADSDMPQDQEENPRNDDVEPKGKTPQQGPTQSWLMTLASFADKPSKTFDELMSSPIDFSTYIMNGLKITNLTQETLLGPAFKLLKGTSTNFAELEYDFEECYKALSEKLNWENPKGGDYPFDLTKPLPLVMNGNR